MYPVVAVLLSSVYYLTPQRESALQVVAALLGGVRWRGEGGGLPCSGETPPSIGDLVARGSKQVVLVPPFFLTSEFTGGNSHLARN